MAISVMNSTYNAILAALKTAQAALDRRVSATQERPASVVPSAGRLVDLTAFFLALELVARSQDDEAPALHQKGLELANKLQDEYVADVNQFLVPLFDGWGLRAFKAKWAALEKPKKDEAVYEKRAMLVLAILNKLLSKQNVMHSVFSDGRVFASAKALAGLADIEGAEAQMKLLASIKPVGHMANTRSWMKHAFTALGVETAEFEEVVADVALAQDLGTKLKNIDVSITNADSEESKEKLAAEREVIVDTIEEIAAQSVNPQAVLSTAANVAADSRFNYRTQTGRDLLLSSSQEDAMMVRGKSIIAASAGSGKTRIMAGKVVYHIKELGARPDQFIATSFSRKSAHELVDRIRRYGGTTILEDGPSTEGFGTTHRVAGSILRRYGRTYDKPLSGGSQQMLMKMAMEQVKMRPTERVRAPVARSFFSEPVQVQEEEEFMETEDSSASMTEMQREAAQALEKISKKNFPDWKWKIVSDILQKIADGKLTNPSPKQTPYANDGFAAAGSKFKISGSVLSADKKEAGPKTGDSRFWKNPANQWFNLGVGNDGFLDEKKRAIGPKQVLLQVTKWKANLVTPEQAYEKNQNVFAAAYGAYEWLKNNTPEYAGWKDHDDTLIKVCQLMVKNPTALAQLKTRFKYILIDEAQDLNEAQHLFFGLIAGTYDPVTQKPYDDGRYSADTYTLIGDDKQAIYSFRGATPDMFINMSELVEGGQGFKTKLVDTNYRSARVIVDAANHLISHNKKQIPMTCKAHDERKGVGVIKAVTVENHELGARLCAETVRDMCQGEGAPLGYGDFGVAVRTNSEAFAFGAEFLRLGIPFRSKINFFNNPTTQALLHWMKLANCNDTDRAAINDVVLKAYRAPNFNLNRVFDETIQRQASGRSYLEFLEEGGWRNVYTGNQAWRNERYVKPYMEMLRAVKDMKGSPIEVLNFIMELRGPQIAAGKPGQSILEALVEETKKDPESTDLLVEESSSQFTDEDVRQLALAPIQPLLDLCRNYEDLGPCMTYLEKLARANDKTHKEDDPEAANYEEPAVVVDTVHGWKGLEVKHMFVPMAKGVFPHKRSEGDEDAMASERRLAYVAITRGQDSVTVLCPLVNHTGKEAGPSQFVSEACIQMQGKEKTGEPGAAVSSSFDSFEDQYADSGFVEWIPWDTLA